MGQGWAGWLHMLLPMALSRVLPSLHSRGAALPCPTRSLLGAREPRTQAGELGQQCAPGWETDTRPMLWGSSSRPAQAQESPSPDPSARTPGGKQDPWRPLAAPSSSSVDLQPPEHSRGDALLLQLHLIRLILLALTTLLLLLINVDLIRVRLPGECSQLTA